MLRFFRRKRTVHAEPGPHDASPAGEPTAAVDDVAEPLSPIAERLQNLDWPTPPDEVRQRCLEEIMSRVGDGSDPPRHVAEDDPKHSAA